MPDRVPSLYNISMNMETPDVNHLKFWIEMLPEEKRLAIETGIFNDGGGVAFETMLEANIEPNEARYIFARINGYLDMKASGAGRAELKEEAKEINALVEKSVLGEMAA